MMNLDDNFYNSDDTLLSLASISPEQRKKISRQIAKEDLQATSFLLTISMITFIPWLVGSYVIGKMILRHL